MPTNESFPQTLGAVGFVARRNPKGEVIGSLLSVTEEESSRAAALQEVSGASPREETFDELLKNSVVSTSF